MFLFVGSFTSKVCFRDGISNLRKDTNSPFILMFVEVELQVVLRAVADDTHTHVTVVNVGVGEEVLHKVLHDIEVGFRDTAGGVQHKHQVHRGVIPL